MTRHIKIALISRADAKGSGASRVADHIWLGLQADAEFEAGRFVAGRNAAQSATHQLVAPRAPKLLKALRSALKRRGYAGHHPVEYPLLAPGIRRADIVHAHDITTAMSPQSLNLLAKSGRPVIWTLHDMSPVTGGCICPIGCSQWKSGCGNSVVLDQWPFGMKRDKISVMNEKRLDVLREGRIELVTPASGLQILLNARYRK